jgi:hypothetical protein
LKASDATEFKGVEIYNAGARLPAEQCITVVLLIESDA